MSYFDPVDELMSSIGRALHTGSLWRRCEWSSDGVYYLHFTVLNTNGDARSSTVLVHDGTYAGEIMTLLELETKQWVHRFEMISYHPVMNDEIERVRLSLPR